MKRVEKWTFQPRDSGVAEEIGIERVTADGNISGTQQTKTGTRIVLRPRIPSSGCCRNITLIREMTATGGVTAESHRSGDSRLLKTDALRVTFSADPTRAPCPAGQREANQQRVENAETLAPATIESTTGSDTTRLSAKKFVAQLGHDGRLEKLIGHECVEIRRQALNGAPQNTSAAELVAAFGGGGEWSTLDESGDVSIHQADRQAAADHASFIRATDTVP